MKGFDIEVVVNVDSGQDFSSSSLKLAVFELCFVFQTRYTTA